MATWPLLDSSVVQQGGAVSASSTLTAITASATAHTKGAWVELVAATTATTTGLTLLLLGNQASTTNTSTLLDIGVGAAGSEVVCVPDIQVGYLSTTTPTVLTVPIRVPLGARISARVQSAVASTTVSAQGVACGGGVVPHETTARATTYGIDTAASRGVLLTTATTANTKSAWTTIAAATTAQSRMALVTIQCNAAAALPGTGFLDIGVGAAGSEAVCIPDLYFSTDASETARYQPLTVPVRIPEGARLSARYQSTITTAGGVPVVAVTLFD